MNRIWWWLIDRVSRSLEPNERDTVLGDFTESGEPAGRALVDLVGLIVRRRAALWGRWLLRNFVAVMIGAGVSFYFRDIIYVNLASPLTRALITLDLPRHLVYTNPIDPFILYSKLSILTGVFLASPYISWQFWASVAPDRYRHEKRYLWPFVTLTSVLFVTGGLFGPKLALPWALQFLLSFAALSRSVVTMNRYWDLMIGIMVGVGLLFDLPSLCWLVYLKRAEKPRRTIQP